MSDPAPLRLVDANGEIVGEHTVGECVQCAAAQDQLDGAERDIKSWRAKYYEAARDREAKARKSGLWPACAELFQVWKRVCHHPKSEWTFDRFMQSELLVKRYGEERCTRAIAGAAYDAFETTRRNGSKQRHDGWDLIFRGADRLEEFERKAPAFWRLLVAGLEARRVPDGYVEVSGSGNFARIWCPGPHGSRPCFASVPILEHEMRACRCGRVYQFERGELWAARR